MWFPQSGLTESGEVYSFGEGEYDLGHGDTDDKTLPKLVESLRIAAFPQISLVAELSGERVGHIFLSPVKIEGQGPKGGCEATGQEMTTWN